MNDNLGVFGAIVAFIALTGIGIMMFGAVTQFILGLFGIAVTFGQACGIGFVLGLVYGLIYRSFLSPPAARLMRSRV